MANFFDQFDAPPTGVAPSGVGQDRPIPTMGKPAPENYFDQFDAPGSGLNTEDIVKSAASGGVEGLFGIAALPGDINELARHVGHSIAEFLARKKLAMPARLGEGVVPTSQELMERTGVAAMLHKPTTRGGQFSETMASMVPGGVAFGGTRSALDAAENAFRYGVIPGAASEAAGEATAGGPAEPVARFGAAVAGGGASRLVTPLPATAERMAAVDALRSEGVTDLTAGQVTGNRALRYIESETGGGPLADTLQNQGEQFTGAALRRTGDTAVRATPENVDAAFHRLGGEFDRLAANNTMGVDVQLTRDLFDVAHDYRHLVGPNTQAPIVNRILNDIYDKMQAGPTISGQEYQALRTQLDRYSRAAKNDPYLSDALLGIRGALDDAMERSMSPQDQAAWRTVRTQYRNLMVVQNAATGGGEDAAMGIISPAKLRQAAVGQDKRGYVRGRNDFSDLAHAGQAIMTPIPQSGTAARIASRVVPAAIGGAMAHSLTGGGAEADIGGLLAGVIAPSLVGRAVLSTPGRAYLGNQLVGRGNASGVDRLIQDLLFAGEPERKTDKVRANEALSRALMGGP